MYLSSSTWLILALYSYESSKCVLKFSHSASAFQHSVICHAVFHLRLYLPNFKPCYGSDNIYYIHIIKPYKLKRVRFLFTTTVCTETFSVEGRGRGNKTSVITQEMLTGVHMKEIGRV